MAASSNTPKSSAEEKFLTQVKAICLAIDHFQFARKSGIADFLVPAVANLSRETVCPSIHLFSLF